MTAPQTPTPGVPLSAESVKLLKAGDVLRCVKGSDEAPAIATSEIVTFIRPSGSGGISNCIVTSADDTFGYRPGRFTFIGRPDAEGWIINTEGWAENPVPGVAVEYRCRSGSTWALPVSVPSDALRWGNGGWSGDIIAFRLTTPSDQGEDEANLSASNAELLEEALSHPPLTTPASGSDGLETASVAENGVPLVTREAAEKRIGELVAENDVLKVEALGLRAAIFGSEDYDPTLRQGNFIEMARTTEAARQGALTRALAAESQVAALKAALERRSGEGLTYRLRGFDGPELTLYGDHAKRVHAAIQALALKEGR